MTIKKVMRSEDKKFFAVYLTQGKYVQAYGLSIYSLEDKKMEVYNHYFWRMCLDRDGNYLINSNSDMSEEQKLTLVQMTKSLNGSLYGDIKEIKAQNYKQIEKKLSELKKSKLSEFKTSVYLDCMDNYSKREFNIDFSKFNNKYITIKLFEKGLIHDEPENDSPNESRININASYINKRKSLFENHPFAREKRKVIAHNFTKRNSSLDGNRTHNSRYTYHKSSFRFQFRYDAQ